MKVPTLIRAFLAMLLICSTSSLHAESDGTTRSPVQPFLDLVLDFQRHPHYWALHAAHTVEEDPARRRTLAVNIARWLEMPNDLGSRYLLVNIPAFELTYWENGEIIDRRPVIVGTTRTPTPPLSATVSGVVLNPWWEIPTSIVRESVGALVRNRPAVARARGYVVENGRYRQRPGPGNALGQMKLVMPNPQSIGLHDTPNQELFTRPVRAFSHGCIRVSDALGFATLVLERDAEWDRDRIDQVIAAGRTQTVDLVHPMPVYIVYHTVDLDAAGDIRFHPDIYDRDQSAAVAGFDAAGTECALGLGQSDQDR
jgi:murein L,D-transpeptidase YcbB/YkuD